MAKMYENDENNDVGENFLSWMTGSRQLNEGDYFNEHDKKYC